MTTTATPSTSDWPPADRPCLGLEGGSQCSHQAVSHIRSFQAASHSWRTIMATTAHHRVLIVGGGPAGISVPARRRAAGAPDTRPPQPAGTPYHPPPATPGARRPAP